MLTLYYSLVYPYLDYGVSLWGSANAKLTNKLKTTQKKTIRIIMGEKYNAHATPIFQKLKILRFEDIYKYSLAKHMFAYKEGCLPRALLNIFVHNINIHNHATRNRHRPHVHVCARNTVQITFIFIDFRVCDFAFAFKTQNAPCVSRFKRFIFRQISICVLNANETCV